MAGKNPLGKIKDVTVGTLKAPAAAVGSAMGLARDAANVGLAVGGHLTRAATETVNSLVEHKGAGHKGAEEAPTSTPSAPFKEAAVDGEARDDHGGTTEPDNQPEPVNVTEELGLDPAPIEKPKRKRAQPKKPTTKIDAAADPDNVDVTPADVADSIASDLPASERAATKPTPTKQSSPKPAPTKQTPPRDAGQ